MALTATRGNKKPFTVKQLNSATPSRAPENTQMRAVDPKVAKVRQTMLDRIKVSINVEQLDEAMHHDWTQKNIAIFKRDFPEFAAEIEVAENKRRVELSTDPAPPIDDLDDDFPGDRPSQDAA